jgi:hypothetical protein
VANFTTWEDALITRHSPASDRRVLTPTEADVVATPATSPPVGAVVDRPDVRAWLRATPGRLRVLSVLLVGAILLCGVLAGAVVAARRDAIDAVRVNSEPSIVQASEAYVTLADADATAASAFLTGGEEDLQSRQRYLDDIQTATDRLSALALTTHSSPSSTRALHLISEQLPRYAGLVETARTDEQRGFPVGAAYLREASSLMRDQILGSLLQVHRAAARRLDRNFNSGTSSTPLAAVAAAGIAVVAILVVAQVYVWRKSRRVFNVGLVAATVLVAGLTTLMVISLVVQQRRLGQARKQGSDAVVMLSSAQILALRAHTDDSLALIARGGTAATTYFADFDATASQLTSNTGSGGLLGMAGQIAQRTGSRKEVDAVRTAFREYAAVHATLKSDAGAGDSTHAIEEAVSRGGPRFIELRDRFEQAIRTGRIRFESKASAARSALGWVPWLIAVVVGAAAVLVLLGLGVRLKEYR